MWDDGEKEVPASGLSDAEKREAALKLALGELPALHEGAASADIDKLRTETTRVASGDDIDAARRRVAKEIAALPPTSDATVSEKRARSLPPSAEEQLQKLRAVGRQLVEAEVSRVEELKQLAIGHNLVVGRDGRDVTGNVPQQLHDLILQALSVVERGDLKHTADTLRELKRWTVIGAPHA